MEARAQFTRGGKPWNQFLTFGKIERMVGRSGAGRDEVAQSI
jgi:hypothetical protein